MINNILSEINITENLLSEYINLINYYKNIKRESIFIRYLNINTLLTVRDSLEVVQNKYEHDTDINVDITNMPIDGSKTKSGIVYDIYEYTPAYYIPQNLNSNALDKEIKGHQFQSNISIKIYTIEKPLLDDLIMFPYPPFKSKKDNVFSGSNDNINGINSEIFRVTGISTAIAGITNVEVPISWYELQLEYAPLYNTSKLNIGDKYIYNLTTEKYILYDKFIEILKFSDKLTELLTYIDINNFSYKYELFFSYDIEGNIIYPLYENKLLFDFLCNNIKYTDYFTTIRRPYGIIYYDIDNITSENNKYLNSNGELINSQVEIDDKYYEIIDIKTINTDTISIFNINQLTKNFTILNS